MINVTEVQQLEAGLLSALKPDLDILRSITEHSKYVHPYRDGLSSQRVVDAVEAMIKSGTSHLKNKPLNLFRNLKMRIKLGYYGL